jgi:hypothetical protein
MKGNLKKDGASIIFSMRPSLSRYPAIVTALTVVGCSNQGRYPLSCDPVTNFDTNLPSNELVTYDQGTHIFETSTDIGRDGKLDTHRPHHPDSAYTIINHGIIPDSTLDFLINLYDSGKVSVIHPGMSEARERQITFHRQWNECLADPTTRTRY